MLVMAVTLRYSLIAWPACFVDFIVEEDATLRVHNYCLLHTCVLVLCAYGIISCLL